ncbi:MAG: YfhO family protein, partial [Oscillospiraceae bacterium]|nr:YfhO family protein [Oscillospiraceae bacterium]
FVAGFDESVFKVGYDMLKKGAIEIDEFSDTNIKGTIDAGEGGIFFTSIPYDKGWNLKIDGQKVEINPLSEAEINDVSVKKDDDDKKKPDPREVKKITDGFVTAPIDGGEHKIELYYITDGLIPGAIISLLCVLIVVGLEVFSRLRKKKKGSRGKKGSKG